MWYNSPKKSGLKTWISEIKLKWEKGNPFGKVGIIKFKLPMTGPVDVTNKQKGLDKEKPVMHFEIEAEDGTTFSAAEDQLKLLE